MNNDYPPVKCLDSGVDWLTATARDEASRSAILSHGERLLDEERAAGNSLIQRQWKGYTLFSCGQIACGERKDGCIIQLRGGLAGEHWRSVLPMAGNVSRLDLALTVELTAPHPALGLEAYRAAKAHQQGRGRPAKITRITDSEGGQTVYLGSRSSDAMVRIYDKGVEGKSHAPGVRWRYELELKRRMAFANALKLALSGEEASAVGGFVRAEVERRGVACCGSLRSIALQRPVHICDDVATYDWLHTSVRPSVEKLRRSYSTVELLNCLGLHDVANLVRDHLAQGIAA